MNPRLVASNLLNTLGAILLASLSLVSTTAAAETLPASSSGIEGTIVVSPAHPGPMRKDDEPSVVPVRDTHFLVKAGDVTVGAFVTDRAGHFQVALKPGHYAVMLEGVLPAIGQWRFEADVVAGRMTKVNWTADSGMR